jgi:hypothetical protein
LSIVDPDERDDFDMHDEMNREVASQYYFNLHESLFGNIVKPEQFDKFWGKFEKKGKITNNGTVSMEDMLKANVEEWKEECAL